MECNKRRIHREVAKKLSHFQIWYGAIFLLTTQKINKAKFNNWFINVLEISDKNNVFLLELLEQEESYISFYSVVKKF
jgi:hypothetical protein